MVYEIPTIDEIKKLEEYKIPVNNAPKKLTINVSKYWLLYNIIWTTLYLGKMPFKLTYKTIAFATKEFMKLMYNLFYFIWYGVDNIVNIAYEAVKDNENIGVVFYIGGEDVDADFKDVDLHQIFDEIKELTPRIHNKIDELKKKGIRMIKIAYSSFTSFWSKLWHYIVDFFKN